MTCRKNSRNWGGGEGRVGGDFNCGIGDKKQSIYGVGQIGRYYRINTLYLYIYTHIKLISI